MVEERKINSTGGGGWRRSSLLRLSEMKKPYMMVGAGLLALLGFGVFTTMSEDRRVPHASKSKDGGSS